VLSSTQCGITEVTTTCAKGGHLKPAMRGKVLSYMPAFQPYRGKPAVRNDREGRGNVGIIRSPIRASTLPDGGGACDETHVPTATLCVGRVPVWTQPFGRPRSRHSWIEIPAAQRALT
jgi:hypothetical protein